MMGLLCQMCSCPAQDHPNGLWEEDEAGDLWVYCRSCDCWTSHPPETLFNRVRASGDPGPVRSVVEQCRAAGVRVWDGIGARGLPEGGEGAS